MEWLELTPEDFLKNAGIVGMIYMLQTAGARENLDYKIDNSLWISKEYIKSADWTDMYFKTFVKYMGPSTVYQTVLNKIDILQSKIENGWNPGKIEKEDLKYISDKLYSNSYQSGFANIKDTVKHPEVYEKIKKEKLSEKNSKDELNKRLQELKEFLLQPLCKETFSMKSIIYNYINRFWDGKCFLLRANAKKDMRTLFEKEFTDPFKRYCEMDHEKSKELCIDCSAPMDSKEKVSIAFMKDMADDLSRKKSAFWNCKVDAFLCPVCAFLYALSPLGFQLVGNKFIFLNINESVKKLISANRKENKIGIEGERNEDEKYSFWMTRITNLVFNEKAKECSNIQVILRGTNADDTYMFQIINKTIVEILNDKSIKKYLKIISQHPFIKKDSDYLNVYEAVIMNILKYNMQYPLLNYLLRLCVEENSVLVSANLVYMIEAQTQMLKKQEVRDERMNSYIQYMRGKMRESGYKLRTVLLRSKGVTTDECLRGTIYQLVNALAVKNESKFMDIVMRTYCSSKLEMPEGFVEMLGDMERFQLYGYAFVLGLKGSHTEKEEKQDE